MNNKKILIIGGTGSLGNQLTKRYLNNNTLYLLSRDERKHWAMSIDYNNHPNLNFEFLYFSINDLINGILSQRYNCIVL